MCYAPVCHSPIIDIISNGFVRLACLRHAASIYPEPGSNSQIKCIELAFNTLSGLPGSNIAITQKMICCDVVSIVKGLPGQAPMENASGA